VPTYGVPRCPCSTTAPLIHRTPAPDYSDVTLPPRSSVLPYAARRYEDLGCSGFCLMSQAACFACHAPRETGLVGLAAAYPVGPTADEANLNLEALLDRHRESSDKST